MILLCIIQFFLEQVLHHFVEGGDNFNYFFSVLQFFYMMLFLIYFNYFQIVYISKKITILWVLSICDCLLQKPLTFIRFCQCTIRNLSLQHFLATVPAVHEKHIKPSGLFLRLFLLLSYMSVCKLVSQLHCSVASCAIAPLTGKSWGLMKQASNVMSAF